MASANMHDIMDGDIESLKAFISNLIIEKGKLDMIYISIGSKYNLERYVQFTYPLSIKDKIFRTNSEFQVIPNFIQFNSISRHTLVISIDNFENPEIHSMNHEILKTQEQNENINIILFNKMVDKLFLENLVEYFVILCNENLIDVNNAMICNYVKFLNCPNPAEEKSEIMIPEIIQNSLDICSSNKYSNCFYQWFGYRYNMYHFIYKYKKHIVYEIHGYNTLLEKIIENSSLNSFEVKKIKSSEFNNFLENIHDITSFEKQIDFDIYY